MRTWMIIVLVVLGFMSIIIMGMFVFGGNLVNSLFAEIDLTIGNQSFSGTYNETLGQGINAYIDGADNWGIMLLLGMVALIIMASYSFPERRKYWIVVEFGILFVAMIFAVILRTVYLTLINSSTELFGVYSNQLIKSSTFLLNIHIIVPILWAIIVILVYSVLPGRRGGSKNQFEDIGA